MEGLKRGTVRLEQHQVLWETTAQETIRLLWEVLGDAAADIQHVGSTSVPGLPAKPILDLAVGMRSLPEIHAFTPALRQRGIVYSQPDHGGVLYVMGDFTRDTRTHHIHVVTYGGREWTDYLLFRDYLRAFPDKAAAYAECKRRLAREYPLDRMAYTEGKGALVARFLEEAAAWAAR